MKKRILGILLSICMVLSIMPAQVFAVETTVTVAEDSDGDGYVEIDTAGKLWWFTHEVNGGNRSLNAELTANIDLSGSCGEGIGNWLPISHEDGYTGNFNGQGFTVSNLYIESDEQYAGLFGYVKSGTIENVTVTGNVSSTFYWTYNPDTYESFDGAAGGIVACLDGGTIRACESAVTVTGGLYFGGICGQMLAGNIEGCINRGTIICFQDSTNRVEYAGIVGHLNEGTVRGCTNHGEVTVGARQNYVDNVGGIVGRSSYGTIENCINMSSIVGSVASTGGIVGKNWVYATVRNCGNLGTVTGNWVGGITGANEGIIEHCWNVAAVSGTSEYVGPIAGNISTDFGSITNNYYLSDTTTEDGGRTAEQFASGQVTYELNGSTTTDESVWKQTLGTDSYPTLAGDNVYYVTSKKCDGTVIGQIYSNSSKDVVVHEDTDNDSFCDLCKWLIITEKIFPDANFRTYITENIDTDKDGLLSSEEIAAVTSINVHGKGISDLSGIKYFTELTELDLTNNNLTSIDISALSKLTILSVYNNTKLASLNLSGNPALEQLNISFCTSLRSLNLSNNINLMSLEAAGCVLTSLDLSHSGAGLIYGSHSSTYIEHCGVGYVNMNLLGDVTRMEITSGGTMGSDGWLLLDPNAADDYGYIWIRYNYDTGNEYDELPVEIRVHHDDFSHTYVANTTSKDATHHYTQWCETCRTGNEEAVVAHTIKYNYTTKYTDSQHKEYCTVCGYYVIETCTYSSECDEVCSECNLTTRLFPDWSVHSFVYTTYEDGDDDSSNDSHSATCEDCGAYIGEFCTYEFACSETCVCGRANPDAAAHTVQYVARGNGTHDKFCGVCKISFELDAPCVYGENTEDSYYFVSPATCISGATWYKSCACGQKSTETFVAGDTDPGNHTGTNDKLVPNGVLHHNVVWSCCGAVVTENVTCVASNADGSCSTAETCVCGNLLIAAKDNHKLTYTASGNVITETCGWTGCEHTATATLHAPENPVYDGTQKLATVTYSDGWAGYSIDAISYSGTANDGSSYAGILRPAVKAGTVTASITAQSEDYTVATASVEYTIEKATNEWTQAPAIKGWTYGEFGNDPTATPKFGSVGISSFSYRLKGTVAWTNNPPSDAGIYELRTRVQASDNWELLETTIEFEIKKATPTVDTFDFTPPANLVCDGLAKEATVTVKEAIEGVGSVTITYLKDGEPITGAPTAVGTYTVQINVAEGANFKPATLTDETWTFTVVEHDPGCHMDANKDMICDGCGMEASVMFDPYKVLIMKGYSSPDWFFVSLYLDSETAEEACENGSEYAIYPDTKTVYAVVTNGDQTETKTVAIDIVYQVEITWTETEFTYVDGEWNPETHEQTGGWEGSCEITLTNTGTMPVDYELTYTSVVEGITGVFSTTENPTAALASGSLDIGDVKTVAFKPEGRPPRDLNDEKIGTLTVKLGGD